jgi:hypothetical protein
MPPSFFRVSASFAEQPISLNVRSQQQQHKNAEHDQIKRDKQAAVFLRRIFEHVSIPFVVKNS